MTTPHLVLRANRTATRSRQCNILGFDGGCNPVFGSLNPQAICSKVCDCYPGRRRSSLQYVSDLTGKTRILTFANLTERYDNEFDPKLRVRIFGLLNLWRFFHKHLCMPRGHGRVLTPSGPNANGKWNFPPYTFPATPLYVKKTVWNQWGPIAILNRLRGLPIPGSQFYSDGVSLESMGAKRKSPTAQAQVEIRVCEQAELINKGPWGYRAKVNFQAWPVVKGLGTGYGFPQNAYSKTARADAKEMNEAPSKSPAPLADGPTVEPSRND